jgi:hypothetical protein
MVSFAVCHTILKYVCHFLCPTKDLKPSVSYFFGVPAQYLEVNW